ncbi:unnamed protein product [Cochlearia groenlandica]
MAKVVAPGVYGSSLQISGGSKAVPKAKRKTPTELRGEQLRRTSFVDQVKESFDALRPCVSSERENGAKKQEHLKNPKYIEMRMDELYPVKKARSWMVSGKENSKENGAKEQSNNLVNVSLLSNAMANKRKQLIRNEDNNVSGEVFNDTNVEARKTIEKCNQSMFRSVTELSTRGEDLPCLKAIDMREALKGLAPCEPLPVHPDDITGKSDTASLRGNFVSELHVPGQKIPLDLSMKTYARLVSSSPLNWLHRSMMGSTYNGMPQAKPHNVVNQDNGIGSGSTVVSQVLNSMSLHSWVYPQSTLPPFIISALVASGHDKGPVDFLVKRQLAWEDAFRSLYFMFRKNLCKLFYVCTSQFVAMFIGSFESGDDKGSCNAYITQSTRRLRANLKELDICYSMPLCKTKIDQTTVEDLAELSELENLGQTRPSRSISNIDNTPESFLAVEGNESVHGLYDLLLNYRTTLGFLLTADVPLLYSPVPFQNAALSSPEIKCTEMVKTDHKSCSIVEIKGEYLPPWIISNICTNVVGANGHNFEASFVTEPTSASLNMALPQTPETTDFESRVAEETVETNDDMSSIPGAVICPQVRAGHLKSLKYCDKAYTVSLSPS